jgi:hypothetical protein
MTSVMLGGMIGPMIADAAVTAGDNRGACGDVSRPCRPVKP